MIPDLGRYKHVEYNGLGAILYFTNRILKDKIPPYIFVLNKPNSLFPLRVQCSVQSKHWARKS